ncbi:TIGR01458 family HAD-type hydrolase [Defluviimonas sp. WL0075]|uniref:Haloacid dehalogenase-like hydrolase domain-containing protein 2 n=1 Tax=Albidovulum sediminicola TaxID=2984331 RepID=A0ABT2YYC8_9RHOB|nr:TIGR01458 family HAD-type hydrolase [Defluviimonas sp. WL0075]MCV2863853.1 TIGR01458 family HAD-type hydrolase [Defluviimonas sp. WL0075]
MAKAVLIDLSGVVYTGQTLLPGAAEALDRLNAAQMPYRFLTNTTRRSKRDILRLLRNLGLDIRGDDLFTPARAACAWLKEKDLSPHLLVHPNLAEDFAGCAADRPKAVVLGDMGPFFNYEVLNAAFRLLARGAPFLALAANRVFLDDDGALSMDAGAFVRALEYSSGAQALLIGKPAPAFFDAAAASMGCALAETAMIGDDAEADVAGALRAGAGQAILVRSGKYRPGDERAAEPRPTAVLDGIADAVEAVLAGT